MKKSRLSAVDNWGALAEQAGFKPAALAKLLGVSLRTLELFFHARIGRSVRDWLNELRLRIAAQRLAAGATISDLVRELGYCHPANYYHQFRDLFHCTPGEFVIEWKRREAEWITQAGCASASASPGWELAEAVRSLEAPLRDDQVRHLELAGRVVRIALVDEDPNAQRIVQEAFGLLAPDWNLESHLQPRPAVEHLAQHPPDVVLMDIRMPEVSEVDCLRQIKARLPLLPIVVFTVCADTDEILLALLAGAVGYLIKPVSPPDLVSALRQALAGGWCFCQKAQAHIGHFLSQCGTSAVAPDALSPREHQVLVHLLQFRTDKDIAERLGISEETVHVHLRRLFQAFGVHSRNELVRKFLRLG